MPILSPGSRAGRGKNNNRDSSPFFRSLRSLATAAAMRVALGLGSASTSNVGTSGAGIIPALDGINTWSAAQAFGAVTATSVTITNNAANALSVTGSSTNSIGFNVSNTTSGGHLWGFYSSGGGPSPVGSFVFYDTTAGGAGLILGPSGGTYAKFPNISTTASAANAFLDSANGNSLLRSTSSLRYKTDVEPIDPAYSERLLDVMPIWYRSLAAADNPEWSWWGFGAEDMAAIDRRMVHWAFAPEDWEDVEKSFDVQVPRLVADDVGIMSLTLVTEQQTVIERQVKAGAQLVPDGVMYDRLTTHHHVLIKQQRDQIAAQQTVINALASRVAALEAK